MTRHGPLGEFEQLVLLAIMRLEGDAYGPDISRFLESSIGREVSRGALYSALARLDAKGHLEWNIDASTVDERGRSRRRFAVTEAGVAALRANRDALMTLWDGLESRLRG